MRIVGRLATGTVALVLAGVALTAALAWHHGYRIYVVHTGSMVPALRPGDAVLDRPAPRAVHPGEIVTFSVNSGPDSVVTHRVAAVSGGVVKTKGDANRTVDPWNLQMSQVVGSADETLPAVGYLLVYLKQPQGIASAVTIVLALSLLWQVFFPSVAVVERAPRPTRRGRHRRAIEPTPAR